MIPVIQSFTYWAVCSVMAFIFIFILPIIEASAGPCEWSQLTMVNGNIIPASLLVLTTVVSKAHGERRALNSLAADLRAIAPLLFVTFCLENFWISYGLIYQTQNICGVDSCVCGPFFLSAWEWSTAFELWNRCVEYICTVNLWWIRMFLPSLQGLGDPTNGVSYDMQPVEPLQRALAASPPGRTLYHALHI